MRPDPGATLFETPARTERLQLLAYLLRNAAQPVYLRGPAGAGKTSSGALVAQAMDDVAGVIWLKADRAAEIRTVLSGELTRAGLPAEPWPQVLEDAPGAQDWLVVIDDADQLDPVAAQELARLPLSRVRLLLLGEGGLDGGVPGPVQFLDLPPLNREQSAEFLRLQAGAGAGRVTDDLVAGLHRATDGQPGALLAALDEILRQEAPVRTGPPPARLRRRLAWGAGTLLALLLAAVLVFQDQVNDWLLGEPPAPALSGPPGEIQRESATLPPAAAPSAQPGAAPVPADPPEGATAAAGAASEVAAARDSAADPLDAVLRDALAAMESPARQSEPAQPQPPAADPTPSAEASANSPRPPAASAAGTIPTPGEPTPAPATSPVAGQVDTRPAQRPVQTGTEGPGAPPATARAPADPAAAEVIDRSVPAAQTPAAAQPRSPAVVEVPTRSPAAPAEVVDGGSRPQAGDWLESRRPERYTLQLVAARDRDAVERYVARHGIKAPYAIFERRLDGRPWYALVAGDYPDRAAALRARDALPGGIRTADVWPRTFASIRELQRTP